MKILLRDRNQNLVNSWQKAFAGIEDVFVSCGEIFEIKADAIISPANSFGFMDGGIDLAYSNFFGVRLQETLKETIRTRWHGEIPVGQAEILETRHEKIKYLVSCPTMRVPEDVSNTVNAYLAFRAGLIAIERFNTQSSSAIQSVLCPGLGTLTGRISPDACALQMRMAYDRIIQRDLPRFEILYQAKTENDKMKHLTSSST